MPEPGGLHKIWRKGVRFLPLSMDCQKAISWRHTETIASAFVQLLGIVYHPNLMGAWNDTLMNGFHGVQA